jgi:hypothetical protein
MGDWFDVYAKAIPVLVTTCPRNFSIEAIDRYAEDYLSVLASGARYVSIVDARATSQFLKAENRVALARFGQQTKTARDAQGTAIIVLTQSVLLRASIRTMHWQAQTGQQTTYVTSEESAIERALEALDQHGVARPSAEKLGFAREARARGRIEIPH